MPSTEDASDHLNPNTTAMYSNYFSRNVN